MLIRELSLCNFRNIKQANVQFGNLLNIIHGANGQGKTNLLEAVYLLALADSYRTNNDSELINFKADSCLLHATLANELTDNSSKFVEASTLALEIKKAANKTEKTYSKDNLPVARVADFIGNFNAVLFAPEDLLLIKSSPQLRRQFLNRILAQSKRAYIYNLQKLNQLLQSKNRLLKELQVFDSKCVLEQYKSLLKSTVTATALNRAYLHELVANLNEANQEQAIKQKLGMILTLNKNFVEVASLIIFERLQVVLAFNKLVTNYQDMLSLGKETLQVKYLSCVPLTNDITVDKIKELLSHKVEQAFNSDFFKGHCSIGPQRDDLEFYLNEKNCRLYASQGQQRTVILALKLAECDYLTYVKQIKPVLLLDDVLSELDSLRQQALLHNIMDRQVLLTCTDLDFMANMQMPKTDICFIQVNQGEITQGKVNQDIITQGEEQQGEVTKYEAVQSQTRQGEVSLSEFSKE